MCRHSVHAMAYMGKSEDNVWKPVFSFYQEGLWDELKSSVKEASAFIHWAILPAPFASFFYFTLKENPVHSNNRQMLTSGWTVGRLEKQGCKNTKGCFLHSGDNFVDAEEGQNSSDCMPETCTNYYRAIVSLKSCQTTGKG